MTETEAFVRSALQKYASGIDGDAVYHPLYKAWKSFVNDPSQLSQIQDFTQFGKGLMFFLSYGTVKNESEAQQIASVGYLFTSKALEQNPNNVNLYKDRLILMLTNAKAIEYTVSEVVNSDSGFTFMSTLHRFDARDAMLKMEFADLSANRNLMNITMFKNAYDNIRAKIEDDFFGPNKTESDIIREGKEKHAEVVAYLEEKIIENCDVDF